MPTDITAVFKIQDLLEKSKYHHVEGNEELMEKYLKLKTKKAKDKILIMLIRNNVALIASRVFHFSEIYGIETTKENLQDLFAEGIYGLMKGIENYEVVNKTKLITYSTYWIDSYIRKAIKNLTSTVSYPDWIFYKNTAREESLRENTKLALSYKVSMSDRNRYIPVLVGKTEFQDENSFVLESSLDGQRSEDIPYLFSTSKEVLKAAIKSCTRRERRILYYRVAEMKTLDELSDQFDISRERVRQIETKAIVKIAEKGFEKEEIMSSIVFMQINIPTFKKKFLGNVI